jgi:transcriptional regulator with XRE-family HTH domain
MGLAIIEQREKQRMTQAYLASKAELAPSSLRQIERGNVDAHWGTIRRLSSALGIPLDALTEIAEELAPAGRALSPSQAERAPVDTGRM